MLRLLGAGTEQNSLAAVFSMFASPVGETNTSNMLDDWSRANCYALCSCKVMLGSMPGTQLAARGKMDRTCPKCGAVKQAASWQPTEACRACGAIYAKVVAAINSPPPVTEKKGPSLRVIALMCVISILVAIVAYGWNEAQIHADVSSVQVQECVDAPCLARAQSALASERCTEEVVRVESPSLVNWGGSARVAWGPSTQVSYGSTVVAFKSHAERAVDGSTARIIFVCQWDTATRSVISVTGVPM